MTLQAYVADHQVLTAVHFHIQRLCKAYTVKLTADLSALIKPLGQRVTLKRNVHHLHVMEFKRLLEKQRQRWAGQLSGQFVVRFTGEHAAKTVHLQCCFITLLLL